MSYKLKPLIANSRQERPSSFPLRLMRLSRQRRQNEERKHSSAILIQSRHSLKIIPRRCLPHLARHIDRRQEGAVNASHMFVH